MGIISKPLTYEEWLNMPEVEDAIEEVVDGEIRIMPPPKWVHLLVTEQLRDLLRERFNPQTTIVVTSAFGLVIQRDPLTCRVPDLAVFYKNEIVEQDGYIHSAPALIVEVLSPSNTRRKIAEKIEHYQSISVPEVWVMSPEARTVEVLLLQSEVLRTVQVATEGQLTPARFPGVSINIKSIWPD